MEDQDNEIKDVIDTLICGTEEILETDGHMDILLTIEIMVDERDHPAS